MPLILQAFLIALALRIAQGSATVALTTTGGLLAADVTAANLSDLKVAALVFAIAAGASAVSHVNHSGFWLVGRFFEMDVATSLRTWTDTVTTLGLATFAVSWLMWLVV